MAARSPGASGKSGGPSKPASKSPPKPVPKSPSKAASPSGRPPHSESRLWNRGMQYGLIAAMLLAPGFAYVIQLLRVPDEIPAPESQIRARVLSPLIAGAIASPQAIGLEFGLEEINTHLGQTLQSVRRGNPAFPFQQVMLRMEPERCQVLAVYRYKEWNLDRHLHLRMTYSVAIQDGKLKVRLFSAQLGRVRLGAFGMHKLEEVWLRKLLLPFKREIILLNRLETLRLEPGRAILKVRPSSPSSPL